MAFPTWFLDQLRSRISLMQIVSQRVQLTRRGQGDYWGCCPFHHEKTPSFHLVEDKGFYHCFGCSAHGDVIKFVIETQGLTFGEAVAQLAKQAGLTLPEQTIQSDHHKPDLDAHKLMQQAVEWYHKKLWQNRQALDFLYQRGVDDRTITMFELGFAPRDQSGLKQILSAEGEDAMTMTGLFRSKDGQAPYPFFRNRIMIPIHSPTGQPIAFGGRDLPQRSGKTIAKYINSADGPLFNKGQTLFNLHRARSTVREQGELIIVEGYMDVIAMVKNGFAAAVAPLGTAITEDQLYRAWRLVDEPVLCFDGDEAGRQAAFRAALRALHLLKPGKSLRLTFLPSSEDPDSMLQAGRGQDFRTMLDSPVELHEFLFQAELAQSNLTTPERRAAFAATLEAYARRINDPIIRRFYLQEFRGRLRTRANPQTPEIWQTKPVNLPASQGVKPKHGRILGWQSGIPTGLDIKSVRQRTLYLGSDHPIPRSGQIGILAVVGHHRALMEKYDEELVKLSFDADLDFWRNMLQMCAAAAPNDTRSCIAQLQAKLVQDELVQTKHEDHAPKQEHAPHQSNDDTISDNDTRLQAGMQLYPFSPAFPLEKLLDELASVARIFPQTASSANLDQAEEWLISVLYMDETYENTILDALQ
ncbi:MAG: DNA primase, partial [Pseudomonadota bacterium]